MKQMIQWRFVMNFAKKIIVGSALRGVLAMGGLGATQAADLSWGWTIIRPLYAVSFDVGREHVLSYFESKNGRCDLTVMVTYRPDEVREGNEMPRLTTVRFNAKVDGGKTAQLDSAQGKALEYACAMDAQGMGVRIVKQLAASSPHLQ